MADLHVFTNDAYWIPKGGASVALGSHTALSQAKDACLRHLGGAT